MNVRKAFSMFLALIALLTFSFPSFADSASSMFTMDDFSVPTPDDAVSITLENEDILIQESGIYSLSGTITDGSVTIDAEDDSIVYLVLNGVNVTNTSGSALHIRNAQKVILTLADGTLNSFTQGTNEPAAKKNDAVIYSNSDLTINGTGRLVAEGNYQDGIHCKRKLRIVSGELSVNSQGDALTGKDAVCIGGGVLDIVSLRGDAITSSNSKDTDLGYIAVSGGILSLKTGDTPMRVDFKDEGLTESTPNKQKIPSMKGLNAESMILFTAGSLTADTTDDAIHSNGSIEIRGGVLELSTHEDGIHADNDLTISNGTIHINHAYEGLEAQSLHLEGGEIRVNAQEDGINAAGGALPETTASAENKGQQIADFNPNNTIHELPESGGPTYGGSWSDVNTSKAATPNGQDAPQKKDSSLSENVPGSTPALSESPLPGSSNGQDVPNEPDAASGISNGIPQQEISGSGFSKSMGTMTITGGAITVISEGDGIDINGDLTMRGGTLYIRGSQDSRNGAIDYDGTFTLTGGTLIALGFSEMAMGPSTATIPGCMISVPAGGLTVAGTDGTSLFTFAPDGIYNNAVIYSDLLTNGETCLITSGDSSQEVVMLLDETSNGFNRRHDTNPVNPSKKPGSTPASSSDESPNLPESIAPAEEQVTE